MMKIAKNKSKRIQIRKSKLEKAFKRKGDELYVKWKDYDNSLSSLIDKKILLYKNELFFTL